jgi:hypothetical protein
MYSLGLIMKKAKVRYQDEKQQIMANNFFIFCSNLERIKYIKVKYLKQLDIYEYIENKGGIIYSMHRLKSLFGVQHEAIFYKKNSKPKSKSKKKSRTKSKNKKKSKSFFGFFD